MPDAVPSTMRQLRSTVDAGGRLTIELVDVDVPTPGPDDVLIRVEATPVNPSDLGMLLAGADVGTAESAGTADRPVVTADVPPAALSGLGARLGRPMIVGNEGAGVVVATGDSADAASLLGRTVAGFGGGMYGEYRCLPASQVLPLPDGTAARDGASCFVNPLTALGDGRDDAERGPHRARAHRGRVEPRQDAGEDLRGRRRRAGQRRPPSRAGGAAGIARREPGRAIRAARRSSPTSPPPCPPPAPPSPSTPSAAGRWRASSWRAWRRRSRHAATAATHRYGSTVHKQVYIYGTLDRRPTEFTRTFGAAWGLGGWLLTNFLQRIGPEAAQALRQRVVDELHTTFASNVHAGGVADRAARPRPPRRVQPHGDGGEVPRRPERRLTGREDGVRARRSQHGRGARRARPRPAAGRRPPPPVRHRHPPLGVRRRPGRAVLRGGRQPRRRVDDGRPGRRRRDLRRPPRDRRPDPARVGRPLRVLPDR